jgi:hypothetical protein
MTDIDFNEPSVGQVNSTKVALEIKNKGSGGCLKCISPDTSNGWVAVWGETNKAAGVVGLNKSSWVGVHGICTEKGGHGVFGEVQHAEGGAGVIGTSKSWIGTYGESNTSTGVYGKSNSWLGVYGACTGAGGHGVYGQVLHPQGGAGVIGTSINWVGVYGESNTSTGVYGKGNSWIGVQGESETTYGVYGHSKGFDGIKGETHAPLAAGVAGYNWTNKGFGIWGSGGEWAGAFQGNVLVTGDISLWNADCAEEFDIVEENVEAGTVMVLTESGSLQPSYEEYDKKVAGIVSGASGYKPAIVLDRQNSEDQSEKNANKDRMPIALMGKVYCKVDAQNSSIEIGDLLTTSSTKGYAMKADDPMKAFGAVIGKALGSIKHGLGMIPVLVSLQ